MGAFKLMYTNTWLPSPISNDLLFDFNPLRYWLVILDIGPVVAQVTLKYFLSYKDIL